MKLIRTLLAVIASCSISLTPVAVAAQSASQTAQPAIYGQDSGVWAQRAGVEKIAEGVWASTEEAQMLREYGCALKPLGLVRGFLAAQAKKGNTPCSTKWYDGLSKVNKEGSMLSLIKLSFGGYLVAESDKGINLTPNHGQWTLYSLDSRSVGRPVTTADATSASGAMVMSDIIKTATGAMLTGVGAAATGSLLQKHCRNCGDTFNLSGGTALAQSQQKTEVGLVSQILVESAASGGCATAGACRD